MKQFKKLGVLLTALAVVCSVSVAAFAAVEDTGFADVAADSWYADAAAYCRDSGLMSGTGGTTFSPDAAMTRAMLATVLYRLAGSPAVTGTDAFADTADGAWYADAVLWASQNGVISGYGGGRFGTEDPVTREQLATILWRCSGTPAAEAGENFADESAISTWAAAAVRWAGNSGYIHGVDGGRFDPAGQATRAQVAAILMRYHQANPVRPVPEPAPDGESDVLVAYFSCTGNTGNVANLLAVSLDADLYEITPEEPYTSADLDYTNSGSRTQVEQRDPSARPAVSGSVDDMEDYEIVFIGYPIWNGDAPRIISTFLESCDWSGKTIVPFCTSASSGIGSSAADLHSLTSGAVWLEGRRFSSSVSQEQVDSWVTELALPLTGSADGAP